MALQSNQNVRSVPMQANTWLTKLDIYCLGPDGAAALTDALKARAAGSFLCAFTVALGLGPGACGGGFTGPAVCARYASTSHGVSQGSR